MLPNNPNNISFFSNETFSSHQETTPPFSMQNSLMNNYQIQTSEFPSKDSSSYPVRKRPHRTDRHSKILTAQGERDRRMRLSVQVARQFFALQDRLGFDTASQTLDWLLNQAKESIDQTKSISELVHEETMLNNGTYANPNVIIIPDQIHAMMPEKMSKTGACTQGVTKDSREKARFRARERTKEKEKMKMKKGVDCTLDQLVLNASVSVPEMDGNYGNELEYYYYLTEILNGNLDDCGMENEDHYKGEFTSGMQFN